MKPPIVALNGGLGNQLFQWIFAHSLNPGEKFRLDYLYEREGKDSQQLEFRLEEVALGCVHLSPEPVRVEKKWWKLFRDYRLWHLANRLWLIPGFRTYLAKIGYFRENPNSEVAQSLVMPSPMRYAYGFFQNAQLIENESDTVEAELIPVINSYSSKLQNRFDLVTPYTVIHIRRYPTAGYKLTPVQFCNLDSKYFTEWATANAGKRIIVLTEFSEQISEIIQDIRPDLVLDSSHTNPWEVLAIMAGAERCLGSNSSLSWWGAKLCSISGGQVWLPSNWSYWDNVQSSDFHFKESKLVDSVWDLSGFD